MQVVALVACREDVKYFRETFYRDIGELVGIFYEQGVSFHMVDNSVEHPSYLVVLVGDFEHYSWESVEIAWCSYVWQIVGEPCGPVASAFRDCGFPAFVFSDGLFLIGDIPFVVAGEILELEFL